MKLDWDLVREVLTEIEEMSALEKNEASFEADYDGETDADTRARHVLLLNEAGFVSGIRADESARDRLMLPDLTWEGHQLLATIRSQSVWERLKTTAKEKGLALSFDLVKIGGKLALEQILKGGASDTTLSA